MLRPGQPSASLYYPNDDAPDTLHLGAFSGDELTGVASVYHEAPPGEQDQGAWRLRGMATLPAARRQGYGAALIRAGLAHVVSQSGTSLWCNARTTATPFYLALGFQQVGDGFALPDIGPHLFMRRPV